MRLIKCRLVGILIGKRFKYKDDDITIIMNIFRRFFPLHLSDVTSYVTHSEYGMYHKKRITYCDLNRHSREIGFIEYSPNTGQIHSFYITNETYKNRGLGSHILTTVLNDIKQSGTKAWLVPSIYPHPFWEKHHFIHTINPHIPFPVYTKQL